ncbi:MAG: S-methyl-5-thioribose-1-phosphate isomerase [Leptolyngbya sp. RL_3_1]|nr:S-methyl-5-thioribose-1-phosphate isomerase [Leptolyngbya sp. RL_3_1]
MSTLPPTLRWDNGVLHLIDQTRLPLETRIEPQHTVEQVWQAIKQLKVRGAPAIGIAGAYGLVIGLQAKTHLDRPAFMAALAETATYLDSARPTAVNLHWALTRLSQVAAAMTEATPTEIWQRLEQAAIQIHDEDRQLCRAMGEYGAPLIKPGMGVLTHCNAGALATAELGTALAPMYLAHDRGVPFRVYADETRPLLQGARLTSWELQQYGIDVTLICDNMAPHLISQGLIDLVVVGTDRVAANGDVANKIGTLGVAIAAQYFGIPFYVACPYSTIDPDTPTGQAIVIEERGEAEVTYFGARRTAPEGMAVRNPAFDVTPHSLVTGLITDRGIISAPYGENLKQTLKAKRA